MKRPGVHVRHVEELSHKAQPLIMDEHKMQFEVVRSMPYVSFMHLMHKEGPDTH